MSLKRKIERERLRKREKRGQQWIYKSKVRKHHDRNNKRSEDTRNTTNIQSETFQKQTESELEKSYMTSKRERLCRCQAGTYSSYAVAMITPKHARTH